MTGHSANVHATAIVVGTAGLLFIGPSGAGKSITAFNCLAAAQRAGVAASLIADDRVVVASEGGRLVATCPDSISGLIEIRGSGILRLPHVASAPLDLAVLICNPSTADRLPPADEVHTIPDVGILPQIRLMAGTAEPLSLIACFYPEIGIPRPFSP
jgi:Serine kinase of the HPr protein, regulates carbohydrate metabolism